MPASEYVEKFSINDADGTSHLYVCQILDPLDGAEIVRAVQHRLTPAVLPILIGMMPGESGGGSVDTREVSQDLSEALFGQGSKELIRQLLNTCHRNGKSLVNDSHYRAAYRRNYYEPQTAAMEVLRVNRIFPPPAISEIWNTVIEMVGNLDLSEALTVPDKEEDEESLLPNE